MLLSIVIPAYNEEQTIASVLEEIQKLELDLDTEIVVVDDGSTDRTVEVARKFSKTKIIRHKRNQGKGAAIRTGIQHAKGEIIVLQDADLEYFPKDIPDLVKPIIEKKADVVFGSRFIGKMDGMSVSHLLGNKVLTYLTRILFRVPLTDIETGYKVFSREVVDCLDLVSGGFEIEPEIVTKTLQGNYRLIEIPIHYRYRKKGESKISWRDGIKSLIYLVKAKIGKTA